MARRASAPGGSDPRDPQAATPEGHDDPHREETGPPSGARTEAESETEAYVESETTTSRTPEDGEAAVAEAAAGARSRPREGAGAGTGADAEADESPEQEPDASGPHDRHHRHDHHHELRVEEVHVVASIERGPHKHPGIQLPAFRWGDVMEGTPPPRRHRGEGAYVVYHGAEVGLDYRVGYNTVVTVLGDHDLVHDASDRDHAHHLHVEELINIQKRTLLELMQRVRDRSDRRAAYARSGLAASLARQRARVEDYTPTPRRIGVRLINLEARAGFWTIEATRRTAHTVVQLPDLLVSAALDAEAMMATRMGRQTLLEALKSPTSLNLQQKTVVAFLTFVLAFLGVLAMNSFFALVLPEYATVYRRVLSDTLVMFLGVIGLPIIVEPLYVLSILAVGPILAFLAYFVGRMAGVYVLYLAGDTLHETLERRTKRTPRIRRAMEWMQANSNRYGFAILFLTAGVPLMPEVAFYVFAVSGIRFRTWTVSIALGTTFKLLLLAGAVYLAGPDVVRNFLLNPLG